MEGNVRFFALLGRSENEVLQKGLTVFDLIARQDLHVAFDALNRFLSVMEEPTASGATTNEGDDKQPILPAGTVPERSKEVTFGTVTTTNDNCSRCRVRADVSRLKTTHTNVTLEIVMMRSPPTGSGSWNLPTDDGSNDAESRGSNPTKQDGFVDGCFCVTIYERQGPVQISG